MFYCTPAPLYYLLSANPCWDVIGIVDRVLTSLDAKTVTDYGLPAM